MGAITIRLSDELSTYLEEEAEVHGYPDAAAFAQAMIESVHERRTEQLDALLDEGLASGRSERSIDEVFEDARSRYRARQP